LKWIGLESLPIELQRNFKLMRDLDSRAESVMQEIDRLGDEFLRTASTASPDKKRELQSKISVRRIPAAFNFVTLNFWNAIARFYFYPQKLFNKAKEYGDDKVQLAIQTYELVDKHIRRLDSDLARFESEIKNGTVAGPSSPTLDTSATGKTKSKSSWFTHSTVICLLHSLN